MKRLPFDIIIVSFKSTYYLLNCLDSIYNELKSGLKNANIFVVENSSHADMTQVIEHYPQVVLIQNVRNVGFASAVNQCIRKSVSQYLILLNPDTNLVSRFFQPVLSHMESHRDISIIGPKILDSAGTVQGSARRFPSALTALFGRSSLLTRLYPKNSISRTNIITIAHDKKTPVEVDWVSGACMVVRRKAIEEVGLLDERFFMYWEDADWCRRMWQKGWKVVYFPQVSIYHHEGKSTESRPLRSIYHFHRSAYLLHEKYTHFPLSLLNPLVFVMLAFRGIINAFIRIAKRKNQRC